MGENICFLPFFLYLCKKYTFMKTKNVKRIIEKASYTYKSYNEYCKIIETEAKKYIDWSRVECQYYNEYGICIRVALNGAIVKVPANDFFVYVKQTIGNKPISEEEYLNLSFGLV